MVWGIGAEGDQKLHGFDPDTGAQIFSGGGPNELMAGTRRFNTGIAARGRIYVANDNKVYAFTVPVAPVVLTNVAILANGSFQLGFTSTPGIGFTALSSTNLSEPYINWTPLGAASEIAPGQFQFTDPQTITNNQERFYRIRTP